MYPKSNTDRRTENFDSFKEKYIEISKNAEYTNRVNDVGLQFFANRSIAKQSDRDWNSKNEVQKAGLVRHWEKEVRHLSDNIKNTEDILAKRLGGNK